MATKDNTSDGNSTGNGNGDSLSPYPIGMRFDSPPPPRASFSHPSSITRPSSQRAPSPTPLYEILNKGFILSSY